MTVSRIPALWALLSFFVSGVAATQAISSVPLDDTVMCVYPISGHYGLLNRILIYVCLAISVLGWRLTWPVTVASAWVFITSSAAAVHIWVLVSMGSAPPAIDLDLLAAWLLVAASLMTFNGMLTFSRMLSFRRARPIIAFWALLILPAPIAYLAGAPKALRSIHPYTPAIEVACRNPNGVLLTSPAQLWRNDSSWNCTYNCFTAKPSLLREADEITVMPANLAAFLPKYMTAGSVFAIAAVLFGFWAIMGGHRSAGRHFFSSSGSKAPLAKFREPRKPYAKDNSPVIPGTIPPEQRRQRHIRVTSEDIYESLISTIPFSILFTILTIPLVIFTELAFNGFDGSVTLPANDTARSIEQWYSWVAFGLVLIAGSFTPIIDYMNKYWF